MWLFNTAAQQSIGGLDHPFFVAIWPVLTGAVFQTAPDIMAAANLMDKDDPDWENIRYFVEHQAEFYLSTGSSKEDGGLYNKAFNHGDARGENIFFPVSREGVPALIDYQVLRKFMPAFDGYYFLIMSVSTEWRQENELELMNVFYDVLLEKSGTDSAKYTWEQFVIELQMCMPFFINVFLFLAPDIHTQADPASPAYDERKKELYNLLCRRSSSAMKEWGLLGEEGCMQRVLQAAVDREAAHDPVAAKKAAANGDDSLPAWLPQAVEDWVPAKWRDGRDPAHYAKWLATKASQSQ